MSCGHGPGPPPEISVTSTGGRGWKTSAARPQAGRLPQFADDKEAPMTMAPTAPAITRDFTDLTDAEAVERARGLRELLRSQQQEAETLGHYTEEVHEALLAAGLYHVLTPKRYGGAELSVKTFMRVAIEIAAGDPGSGWSYCLGQAHCLTAAAQLPERAQDKVFRNDAGYFRSPLSYNTQATATPVDGGFLVKGKSLTAPGSPSPRTPRCVSRCRVRRTRTASRCPSSPCSRAPTTPSPTTGVRTTCWACGPADRRRC
jgi:hypothetical protein